MPSAARAFHLLRLLLSLPFTPFFCHHFLFLQTISSSIKPTVRIDRLDKYFNNYSSTIPDGGLSAVKAHDLEKREQSVSPSDKRKATARKTFFPWLLSFQLYISIETLFQEGSSFIETIFFFFSYAIDSNNNNNNFSFYTIRLINHRKKQKKKGNIVVVRTSLSSL